MINISVLGATGYAGIELTRLLASHPEARIKKTGIPELCRRKAVQNLSQLQGCFGD